MKAKHPWPPCWSVENRRKQLIDRLEGWLIDEASSYNEAENAGHKFWIQMVPSDRGNELKGHLDVDIFPLERPPPKKKKKKKKILMFESG